MSSVTTTKVDTANATTTLTLTTGNTTGPNIVVTGGTDIQLNGNTVSNKFNVTNTFSLGNYSIAANGYTTLPNGIILQWGKIAATTSGSTITFSTTFANGPLSIQLTGAADTRAWVTTLTSSNSNISVSSNSDVYYTALGY